MCFSTAPIRTRRPNINVITGLGEHRSEAMRVRSPRDNYNVNANVDYAVTLDQTLRFGFGPQHRRQPQHGHRPVGRGRARLRDGQHQRLFPRPADRPAGPPRVPSHARAIRLDRHGEQVRRRSAHRPRARRVHQRRRAGPRRTTRAHDGVRPATSTTSAAITPSAPACRSMPRGGDRTTGRTISAPTPSRAWSPTTLERPRSYTQRIGDPNVKYENYQGAFYVQDDIRVRRNFTVSGGLRYEAQTHAKDYDNVMPRLGITWAPFTGGQTTLRASWGIFHDWFSDEHLRADSAGGRRSAAGNRHRQSAVSGLQRAVAAGGARQSLPDERRRGAAALHARQPRPRPAMADVTGGVHLFAMCVVARWRAATISMRRSTGPAPIRSSATSSRWCPTRARGSISCSRTSP